MNKVQQHPLYDYVMDAEQLDVRLMSASDNLRQAINAEAEARRNAKAAEEHWNDLRNELIADAILAANAGDESSPLHKVAATSKAWGIIADDIPVKARQKNRVINDAYRAYQATQSEHMRAAADLEMETTRFRGLRSAAEMVANKLRALSV